MLTNKTQADVLDALCALAFAAESRALTDYDRMLLSQSVAGARRAIAAYQAPAPAPYPTLAIVIEGGCISAIVSDLPEMFRSVDVMVIDYDTDGSSDDDDVIDVQQFTGATEFETERAHVTDWPVDRAKIDLAAVAAALDARSAAEDGL